MRPMGHPMAQTMELPMERFASHGTAHGTPYGTPHRAWCTMGCLASYGIAYGTAHRLLGIVQPMGVLSMFSIPWYRPWCRAKGVWHPMAHLMGLPTGRDTSYASSDGTGHGAARRTLGSYGIAHEAAHEKLYQTSHKTCHRRSHGRSNGKS